MSTALTPTPSLRIGENLWLKLENLQPTASFKVRGFSHAVDCLEPAEIADGIVTVSAGNAALAAAYVAGAVGVPCTVVMFDTAPASKREGTLDLGAQVLSWPRHRVLRWMAEHGWESMPERFIHPFADPILIEGHGSIVTELLEQVPEVRRILVPVGGGGLISGITRVVAEHGSTVEVVGVQSSGYPLWCRTFADGHPPTITPATIADGTTAPYDARMHERLRAVGRWVEVDEGELRRAVADLALRHKVVAEGAGALAYAAMRTLDDGVPTVAVVSGGNIDASRLTELLAPAASVG